MRMNKKFMAVVLSLFILTASGTAGQRTFQLKSYNISLEVLPESVFEAQFGNNPDMPRTDDAVIALALKLYQPRILMQPAACLEDWECGEYEIGLLFAALQNPAISDQARMVVDQIIKGLVPTFDTVQTVGHFKFYYCVNSGTVDDRVTDAEITSLAGYMNSYWTKYTSSFKTPKHYHSGTSDLIDVKVFYLGTVVLGQTSSSWKHIELNSKYCVKDAACKRRTTSAHELFHRVQYAYGYVSGTGNMKWIVEGSASWSQKFTNIGLRDYMGRMNQGLDAPDKKLITDPDARSYDACHYWVYLQKRAGTYAAIKDVWQAYFTNGYNAKAAVQTVVVARGLATSFDNYTLAWNKASFIKDYTTSKTSIYEYDEDPVIATTGCGEFALADAPRVGTYSVGSNSTIIGPTAGTVLQYGADCYEFNIGASVTRFKILLTRSLGACNWVLVCCKSGLYTTIYGSGVTPKTWDLTFTAGTYDKIALIVAGRNAGASYTFRVGP